MRTVCWRLNSTLLPSATGRCAAHFVFGVHSCPSQRHPVLPADQTANFSKIGFDGREGAAVTASPNQAFGVSRHQFAVDLNISAVFIEENHGLVKGTPRAFHGSPWQHKHPSSLPRLRALAALFPEFQQNFLPGFGKELLQEDVPRVRHSVQSPAKPGSRAARSPERQWPLRLPLPLLQLDRRPFWGKLWDLARLAGAEEGLFKKSWFCQLSFCLKFQDNFIHKFIDGLINLNNSQTIKVVIPAKPVLAKAGSGNPLQINNLVQVMDARLLGHDNIEVFCLKWKFMN